MSKMGLMIGVVPEVDPKNKKRAEEYWMYGSTPEELAKAWGIDKDMAKLKKCTNCEYFDNRKYTLKALEIDATMGACTKFKFACSGEASCQAWDCEESEQYYD
jgi:hypothetical protein